jgi:YidC/Oxa1 family membrane protein insertase
MEDKKQSLAILIIILIVITYFQYVSSKDQKKKALIKQANQSAQTSTTANPIQNSGNKADVITMNQGQILTQPSTAVDFRDSPKTLIDNGLLNISISHLGGRIVNLELKDTHKDLEKTALYDLVKIEGTSQAPGAVRFGKSSDDLLTYSLVSTSGLSSDNNGRFVVSSQSANLVFEAKISDNLTLKKTFGFDPNSYLFKISSQFIGTQASPLELAWNIHIKKEDLEQTYDPFFFSVLDPLNKVSHTQATSGLEDLSKAQPAEWLSFGDRYFMTTLLPKGEIKNIRVESLENNFTLITKGSPTSVETSVYAGPKNYEELKTYNLSLERNIDLGFFSFISYPLLQLLRFLYQFFGNYGVAIVALTLLVKTVLYPLNRASLMSMKGMQEIAPEIQALRERIKDPTQLNKEIFALYKRKGVNPMGGCLPIALQIPVFFGLYSALQNAVELRHAPFALWVQDLATPEKLNIIGINVPVMVIAMGVIMFIQQYRTPMPNVEPAQRKMVLSMSVVFTLMFLIFPFPAGLALYMLVNTVISLIQQQCLKSTSMNNPFAVTVGACCAILAVSIAFSKL